MDLVVQRDRNFQTQENRKFGEFYFMNTLSFLSLSLSHVLKPEIIIIEKTRFYEFSPSRGFATRLRQSIDQS